jgi:hypothetical protein
LELCPECVWVEFPTVDGPNLLIGNHYFPPDAKPQLITDYFHHLENMLDINNFHVILLRDFNAPGFNWRCGTSLPSSHHYSKLKGNAMYTSACLLGLGQLIEAADSPNLLDLVFANFSDLASAPADFGLIKPNAYHPPLIICTYLQHFPSSPTSTPSRNFSAGDYILLYSTLSVCDWSDVYNSTSVDGAVARLSRTVHDAMEKSIPYSHAQKSKFMPWFSKALRYYIAKKNYYRVASKRNKRVITTINLLFIVNLLNTPLSLIVYVGWGLLTTT